MIEKTLRENGKIELLSMKNTGSLLSVSEKFLDLEVINLGKVQQTGIKHLNFAESNPDFYVHCVFFFF